MKIRYGYVSNSRSSSYYVDSMCLMGIDRRCKHYSSICRIKDGRDGIFYSYDDNGSVGVSITEMLEDETKAQFRKRVYELFVKNGFVGSEDEIQLMLCEFSGECE